MNRRFTHGGNIYDVAPGGGEWLDFSANINPLGLSQKVRQAIENGIEKIVHYPDPSARALKRAIAEHYEVPRENIVLGNGGAELFYVFFHAVRPKRVLLPVPSFSEYERAALSAGAEVVYLLLREENDFQVEEREILPRLQAGDCLILGNPNNPTGQLAKADVLEWVIGEARRKNVQVLIDESFVDFRSDVGDYTLRQFVGAYDNLIVVQSLTKFYAIPGLRLGFAVTTPELAGKLETSKDPWNTNLLAQAAGVAALGDGEYRKRTLEWLEPEREYMYRSLSDFRGIKTYRPTVNFIFLRLSPEWGTSTAICERMKEERILIRNCSNYPGLDDTYVRVAVKMREENEVLLDAFRRIGEEQT